MLIDVVTEGAVLKFVNRANVEKDTCLDVAIVAQNTSGKREHDGIISFLNSINAHSNRLGSHAAVAKYLSGMCPRRGWIWREGGSGDHGWV